ncbi:MAG: radical SAM protein [Candidatus Aminicenantes bacterium]|nr:radical SAM protein [Candidatus Aminicenantes bacterium]
MFYSQFSLYLTEKCNYSCTYCYQSRAHSTLDFETIHKTLRFFLPELTSDSFINFTGGEPLLAFDLIRETVEFLEGQTRRGEPSFIYQMTTNGSLLDREKLEFFNSRRFRILLSFDGLSQDTSRQPDSRKQMEALVETLPNYPSIETSVNCILTPSTVRTLLPSFDLFMSLGIKDITFTPDLTQPWEAGDIQNFKSEMTRLADRLADLFEAGEKIPVRNFRGGQSPGLFICGGGFQRLALTPDSKVWGCEHFFDYFRTGNRPEDRNKYCFGREDDGFKSWKTARRKIVRSVNKLQMRKFRTPSARCASCPELRLCFACPVTAAYASGKIGLITEWECLLRKEMRHIREDFLARIGRAARVRGF